MLSLLKDYKGAIEINGTSYNSIRDAMKRFKRTDDNICIRLYAKRENANTAQNSALQRVHKITVKQYMTRQATPEFDFMKQFNNDVPMPLRTMLGTVEKETRGMVYMNLHADITEERTLRCLKCGRPITNPVSQYFGLGPECGGHNYVNPFYSEEELKSAVAQYREQLRNITWSGWIIKSAILTDEEV